MKRGGEIESEGGTGREKKEERKKMGIKGQKTQGGSGKKEKE